MSNERDAAILRAAAAVLKRHSRKPNGLWLKVMWRVLCDTANRIEAR